MLEKEVTITDGRIDVQFLLRVYLPRIQAIEVLLIGPDIEAPTAPGSLTFSQVSTTSATLTWTAATDNVGVTGYRVLRDGVEVATLTELSHTDSGLAPSTPYSYSVVAEDSAGNESAASTAAVTTLALGGTIVRVNAGGPAYTDAAGNAWLSDRGFIGSSTLPSSGVTMTGTADPELFRTSRYDNSTALPQMSFSYALDPGTYLVRLHFAETAAAYQGPGLRVFDINIEGRRAFEDVDVFALAGGGNKALVLEKQVAITDGRVDVQFLLRVYLPRIQAIEILPVAADTQAPAAPQGLAAPNVTPTSVSLTWSAATDNVGVTGYRITRDGVLVTTVVQTSFSDSGLSPGTSYIYGVAAIDAAGNASASTPRTVDTPAAPDSQAPTPPGPITFTGVGSSSLTVGWTASTDNVAVTGYRLSRDEVEIATVAGLTYTDSGLSTATSYSYAVVALDAAGNVSTPSAATISTASGGPVFEAIRVNAGGTSYVDSHGNTWAADTGYNTGETYSVSASISNTAEQALFRTERFDRDTAPELTYEFTVPNGLYTVNLYFAENFSGAQGAGLRVFDIDVESARAFDAVDIFTLAGGGNRAMALEHATQVNDGRLEITFLHRAQNPKVNAIEILPGGTSLAILSGDDQTAPAGAFNSDPFDVAAWNSVGPTPIIGAPLTFDVVSGGGMLALSNTGSPALASGLTVTTDADGTARAYYKHSSSSGVVSQIRASLGAASVLLQTTSTTGGGGTPGDVDGDGLTDTWEVQYFGNTSATATADNDEDGLTNLVEFTIGSNPTVADTDGDGMNDGAEIAVGRNPLDPSDAAGLPAGCQVIIKWGANQYFAINADWSLSIP